MTWFHLDLSGLQRQILNRVFVDDTASSESIGTRSTGPIHIHKTGLIPNGSPETGDAIARFDFVFPGQDTPLTFTYDHDLPFAIDDFLEDHDLDMEYAMPVQMAVLAGIGAGKWAFGFEDRSCIGTTVPTTEDNVALEHTRRTEGHDLNFCDARDMSPVQVASAHSLRDTPNHLLRPVFPHGDTESFTTAEFLRCAVRACSLGVTQPVSTDSALVVLQMISGTLLTAAVMFHTDAQNCYCQPGYLFEHEQFQKEVKTRLRLVLPHFQQPNAELLAVRVRYLFTLLESALAALNTPLQSVVPDLLHDVFVVAAIRCITESLDRLHTDHAAYLGPWAWYELLAKLYRNSADETPSVDRSFYGRVGNQARVRQRSPQSCEATEEEENDDLMHRYPESGKITTGTKRRRVSTYTA